MNHSILRLSDVLSVTKLSRSSIYSFIQQGKFPRQVHISNRLTGWIEAEVQAWISNRISEREAKAAYEVLK